MNSTQGRVLLVDDDPSLLKLLSLRLRSLGHEVKSVESGDAALAAMESFQPQTIITDLRMEPMDGVELLDAIHRRQPGLPVLIITAHGTIPDAVSATKHGAFGFLTKPIDKKILKDNVQKALSSTSGATSQHDGFEEIVTRNKEMLELLNRARLVARADTSVLITGESGTGKELLARAIHRTSTRAGNDFVAINCAAIPKHLLESELFGHERGAFTGANSSRDGLFQTAHGGTLFLDEIGDMPLDLQVKLLRTLQEKEVRRIGSNRAISVDVRVISATHRNLAEAMTEGHFREDLYYRLNVVNLHLPPLDARREDIPLLANQFLMQLSQQRQEPKKVYTPEAMELLVTANWPGNIRHLYNVVEQNVVLTPNSVISPTQVLHALGRQSDKLPSFSRARDEFTRNYLSQLLSVTGGNVSQAARLAKRNRTDFYKLLSRFDINPKDFKPH